MACLRGPKLWGEEREDLRRSVLVTVGGAGFIGSAFVRSLFDEDPDVSIMVLDVARATTVPVSRLDV